MTAGGGDFRFSPRPNRAAEIDWRPWGETAFAEARRLGRPVLLSLSAVWCHWCHVMDETSYSDPRVIERVNRDYVPVRVDNDRDPDVNRRYNMGGWPTTAFLTAGGEVITGATYLPPDDMLAALENVRAYADEHRDELAALDARRATERTAARERRATTSGAPTATPPAAPRSPERHASRRGTVGPPTARRLRRRRGHARRSRRSSRPPGRARPSTLCTAASAASRSSRRRTCSPSSSPTSACAAGGTRRSSRRPGCDEVLHLTLTRMAAGDVYDRVEKGFFRYATRRDWTVPHYEKMLEDNARLATLYLDAALAAGAAAGGLRVGARGPAARRPNRVTRPPGAAGAGAAQGDATAYRRTAAGVIDYLMGTLWRRDPPAFGGSQDADERYYALDAAGRSALAAPFIDTTVYVDWNALAARALLRAATVLDRSELTASATALLDHLWTHARRDGAMVHYLTPDGAQGATGGLLGDQAAVAAALLDAYEVTGRGRPLERAEALAAWVGERLRAPDGRFVDREPTAGSGGLLDEPLPTLDENAAMADVLLRLEAYTGEPAYRERALGALAAWAPHVAGFGVGGAPFAATLLRALSRPDHLIVIGDDDDRGGRAARGRPRGAAAAAHRATTAP